MELSGFLKIARRWAFVLVGAAIVGGVTGYVVAQGRAETYRATTQLLVGPISGDFQKLRAAAQLAETYAELAVSGPVLEAAIKRVKEPIPPGALRSLVSARSNGLTRLLTVTVTHADPQSAASLANALGAELVAVSLKNRPPPVEGKAAPVNDAGSLRVVEPAVPPSQVTSSGSGLVTAMAALAGLGAAFIAAMAVEAIGGRLREPSDVEEITGAACIPIAVGKRWLNLFGRRHDTLGAYRIVAATLDARDRTPSRSIAIAPVDRDASGVAVAIGVAEALGASGQEVVLVDADSSIELTRRLGLQGDPGLNESFTAPDHEPRGVGSLRRPSNVPGLTVLSAGTRVRPNVDRDQALKVLQLLLNEVDRVVLSSGSPLTDVDCLLWARSADAVMLVATEDRTRRRDLQDATRSLQMAGAKVTATLLLQ